MKKVFLISLFFALSCDTPSTDTNEESPSIECSTQLPSECDLSESCFTLFATPLTYNQDEDCYIKGEEEAVGCMSNEYDCGAMEVLASSSTGECMLFSNTCYPESWNQCDNFSDYRYCP